MQNLDIAAPARSLTGSIDVPDLDEYDGISPAEIDAMTPNPLADLSDLEREELAQEISEAEWQYRRAVIRDAEKEAATAREGMRENILLEYGTPENYYHAVGTADDADHTAKLFGLGKNWLEPVNIRRRADGRRTQFQKQTKAHQMKGFAPVAPSVPKLAPAPAKKAEVEQQDPRDIVRAFYAEAVKQHPNRAKKLEASLAFQLEQYGPTLERLTGKGKSEAEAVAIWQKGARAAMEAKIA